MNFIYSDTFYHIELDLCIYQEQSLLTLPAPLDKKLTGVNAKYPKDAQRALGAGHTASQFGTPVKFKIF